MALLNACLAVSLMAQLETPPIIRSGMVVQRDLPIPLWGSASPGSLVTARLGGFRDTNTASTSGGWEITLPAMQEGGPYVLTIVSGSDTLAYTDVYVGDVWLASGQSNMAWTLDQTLNAAEEIAGSDNPEIRHFLVNN
jgi:sialate O-acetylesterase